jgi:hypothetical protein
MLGGLHKPFWRAQFDALAKPKQGSSTKAATTKKSNVNCLYFLLPTTKRGYLSFEVPPPPPPPPIRGTTTYLFYSSPT